MKGCVGVRLREADPKTHGHTRSEFCVEVKGSIEGRLSIEVKEIAQTKKNSEVKGNIETRKKTSK